MSDSTELARLRILVRRIFFSRLALGVEGLVREFWPVWTLAAFVLALGLSGILPLLGGWLHLAVLVLFATAFTVLLLRACLRWRIPGMQEARMRLDRGEPARPAAAAFDRQVIGRGDALSEGIWRLHLKRVADTANGLRAAPPDLRLSSRDPLALRAVAVLLLGAAGVLAGPDWKETLSRSLAPDLNEAFVAYATPPRIEAWATPPAYTGVAPLYLTEQYPEGGEFELPFGTDLEVRVFGARRAPVLELGSLEEGERGESISFVTGDAGIRSASVPLEKDLRVAVRLGNETLGEWSVRVRPDRIPTIEFATPPQATRRAALTFAYRVSDDYGPARAWALIESLSPGSGDARILQLEPVEIPLALPVERMEESEEFVIHDLSAHPWAGSEVTATLFVEDDLEQIGESETVRFRLPERDFEEPMARSFAEQRRELATGDTGHAVRVLNVLWAVTRHPEDYFDDIVPYLAGRVAVSRLMGTIGKGSAEAEISSVLDLLWRAARRLEEGPAAEASGRLREAIRALEEALTRGADEAEISDLLRSLREALGEYLQALREEARKNPGGEFSEEMQLSGAALENMLDSLENNARLGLREQARRLLAQFNALQENLRAGNALQQDPALSQLGEIIEDQLNLADRTLETGRAQTQFGADSIPEGMLDSGALAAMQEELAGRLEELIQRAIGELTNGEGDGETPGARLGGARNAMGRAQGELEGGQPRNALGHQLEAVENLRAAAQGMMLGAEGRALGILPDGAGGRNDPFGQFRNWGMLFGDTALPQESDLQRARELFDTIRRRSGERARPLEEREYLERLIDRF